ncbi:hypothetical protein BJ166DRAFT_580939 [Pestalotiopsis sp. NC0098]|nr:hypothetical protein BJ166DRAFT_580939 [Pestalotiopsis sp. NC0098]
MAIFLKSLYGFVALLMTIGSVIAAPPHITHSGNTLITVPSPTPTIPASCFTTFIDAIHRTGTIKGPSCYTATTTFALNILTSVITVPCFACPPLSTPIACPAIAFQTIVDVPCATDCCPTTSTTTLPGTCPPCGSCVIPTYTSTVTTGCKTSSGYHHVKPTHHPHHGY